MKLKTFISWLLIAICLLGGMQFYLQPLRETQFIQELANMFFIPVIMLPEFPQFIAGSLADGLWMMALTLTILIIWDFRVSFSSALWYLLAIVSGFFYEILQAFRLIPGVFDWNDLMAMMVGFLLPIFFLKKSNRYEQFS